MERENTQIKRISIAVLVLLHGVGLLGFSLSGWAAVFRLLTPWHLLISALVLFAFHKPWNRAFGLFCLGVIGLGWGLEVLGVHTQQVFGAYHYGEVLGWAPAGVPVLIGLNWLALVYAAGMVFQPMRWPLWMKAAAGSLVLIVLDVALERFAISHGLWHWRSGWVPLQNYLAWFMVSFAFLSGFHRMQFRDQNPIALAFILIQGLFFYSGWFLGIW